MGHKKEDVIKEIENYINENDVKELHNQCFINRTGFVKDGNERYYEIIAEKLLELNIIEKFQTKKPIRIKDYAVYHNGETKNETNRREEMFAKELFRQGKEFGNIGDIGKIIDYQVPLNEHRSDKAGKIDLVSFRQDTKTIYLIELKRLKSTDTLLKCILEIATYRGQLSQQNFLNSYKEFRGLGEENIRKAVLIREDSEQYKECNEIQKLPNSKLKELIKELKVEIFLILGAPPYSAQQLYL